MQNSKHLNKMETTLKVTVKNCGKAAGTLGWFNSILEDSEIIIRPNRENIPGLFLHKKHKKDGTESKENEENTWICGPISLLSPEYCNNSGKISHLYVIDDEVHNGFTGYALTPACEKEIERFIEYCVDKFSEWWEEQ